MSLAVSLQPRLDALRRKCSTGYGCGSACISLRKECRTSPRSAIGKQRMKRLLELAAGGASSQRGIAPLRGKEAVAHYEPTMKVINLTRKKGVGSLSHEWGHALDNYAAGGGSFLSGNSGAPEKRAAMKEVKSAWTTSGFTQQVYDSIREVKKGGGQLSEDYWLSDVEMFARSFEAHVSLKLEKAGRANTYLTREFDDSGMKKGNAAERRLGDGLWPTRKQAEAMEPMFDALLAQIKKDDFPGASNRRDSRGERIQRLIQEAYQAATADHRAAASLQQRIDAAKRKCTTGYSCGAGCISMSKPGKGKGFQNRMQDIGFEFADPDGQFPADRKDADILEARLDALRANCTPLNG